MKFRFLRPFLNIFILLSFLSPVFTYSATDSVDINLYILGCNNNGICEVGSGEDFLSCSNDCFCDNDGICEAQTGETLGNCPLDCTVPEPPDPDPEPEDDDNPTLSGHRSFNIFNIEAYTDAEDHKAFLSWETTKSALSVLYWGRDQDYKISTLSSVKFTTNHFTTIGDIQYGTYYFIIKARDFDGNIVFSDIGTFTLTENEINFPPNNPSNFRTFPTKQPGIGLAWANPSDDDFDRVRLVREENNFPSTYLDGKVVYEGGGQSVIDFDVEDGKTYYYSIFSIDNLGNVSSGAILKVKYSLEKDPEDIKESEKTFGKDFYDTLKNQSQDPNYFPLDQYVFSQKGEKLGISNGIVVVNGGELLQIQIDEKYVQPGYDVIIYFNINPDKPYLSGYKFQNIPKESIYKTIIPSFGVEKEIPFIIQILNQYGNLEKESKGTISSFLYQKDTTYFGNIYDELIPSWIFWIILGLMIFLFLVFRKKRP